MGCCKFSKVSGAAVQTSPTPGRAHGNTATTRLRRGYRLPENNTPQPTGIQANHRESRWTSPPSQPTTTPYTRKPFYEVDKFINVLLLGESGVGKSTFINALVNYLRFDTLEQARLGEPVALMPVSFLITAGHHFEERVVRFGGKDPNEDHHHPGQSVTQHCRSYTFTVGTETKLRLIDTPGMGDTRGPEQDDLNMKQILSFINNLSHLDAICILLKPNESKLNVVFRSYFTRLIDFLGDNVCSKIIFCFTNTRTTFFAPGDTGPLLRKMLKSHSIKNIPFEKANTFCFDNESFRYLIALQNGLDFDDYQKDEYQNSWVASVTESTRLLQYICDNPKPYRRTEWKSIGFAELQINQMIRPLLEVTRNLFRNLILQEENNPSRLLIRLSPTVLSQPSTICTECDRNPRRYGDFWILPDNLHTFSKKCIQCDCDQKQHIDVDYELKYESLNNADKQSVDRMKLNLDQVQQAIIEFGYFFRCISDISKPNDPVLSYLNQIIEEEKQICEEKGQKCLNVVLLKKLDRFKEDYEQQQQKKTKPSRNSINLENIYKLIQSYSENDLIKEHMNVIKQYHQKYMTEQEKNV